MRSLTLAVAVLMLITGCATVQHPNSPGVQYGSLDVCYEQHKQDSPGACTKTIHQQATTQAIGVGATIFLILSYVGLVTLAIVGTK